MARRKQKKKDEYFQLSNCFDKASSLPGKWTEFFGNDNPLHLELGCGHGDLSLEMARKHPEQNFLGIDLKPDRMWRSARFALADKVSNVAFLCLHLLQLPEHVGQGEADSLWITFPDPFSKKRQAKHRMVNRSFLKIYEQVLAPGGLVQFKTDNLELFHFGLEEMVRKGNVAMQQLTFDLHENEEVHPDTKIKTTYERRFLDMGMKINYVSFRFNQ